MAHITVFPKSFEKRRTKCPALSRLTPDICTQRRTSRKCLSMKLTKLNMNKGLRKDIYSWPHFIYHTFNNKNSPSHIQQSKSLENATKHQVSGCSTSKHHTEIFRSPSCLNSSINPTEEPKQSFPKIKVILHQQIFGQATKKRSSDSDFRPDFGQF